jgi:hypothetical protein
MLIVSQILRSHSGEYLQQLNVDFYKSDKNNQNVYFTREKKMRSKILSFLTLTALVCLHVTIVYGSSGEIDAATIVNNIVDGDTLTPLC